VKRSIKDVIDTIVTVVPGAPLPESVDTVKTKEKLNLRQLRRMGDPGMICREVTLLVGA
jgi:hypothetical protein